MKSVLWPISFCVRTSATLDLKLILYGHMFCPAFTLWAERRLKLLSFLLLLLLLQWPRHFTTLVASKFRRAKNKKKTYNNPSYSVRRRHTVGSRVGHIVAPASGL